MGSIAQTDYDVIVTGAGFGGCYLLHLLRKQGFLVRVLEAGSRTGGVWCWNCYPGARVDCEMPFYGFSDPEIWNTFEWTERFPSFKELRAYFDHVDKVWDLSKDISFNTRVTEAQFNDGLWTVKTADGAKLSCKWFVAATGTSFKQHIPTWKGIERFKGNMHHSSLWPEEGVELAGKRVAVIGAGSTGVQVMQEAAKIASSVTQFIRSPNLALPMRQRRIGEEERYQNKAIYPHVFRACRETRSAMPITNTGRKVFDDSPEQREALLEEMWKRGGFNWSQGCYIDHLFSKEANREIYAFWAKKTRQRIKDPKKRDLLAPLEPPYYISTKRPSLEQDYFESCDQPHVEVTDSPIVEFTETGIQAKDKLREFDVIAICTGYDAVTGGLRTMGVKGRDGMDLDQKWSDGVATHLGMIMHGYPNFFMVYGPQAPTSLTNGPPFIEMQCEWILDVLQKQQKDGLATVEATREAEDAWRQSCLDIANKTLAVLTNSWWMGANVPGKKQEFLLYMGGIPAWHQACRDALEGWSGFDVTRR